MLNTLSSFVSVSLHSVAEYLCMQLLYPAHLLLLASTIKWNTEAHKIRSPLPEGCCDGMMTPKYNSGQRSHLSSDKSSSCHIQVHPHVVVYCNVLSSLYETKVTIESSSTLLDVWTVNGSLAGWQACYRAATSLLLSTDANEKLRSLSQIQVHGQTYGVKHSEQSTDQHCANQKFQSVMYPLQLTRARKIVTLYQRFYRALRILVKQLCAGSIIIYPLPQTLQSSIYFSHGEGGPRD